MTVRKKKNSARAATQKSSANKGTRPAETYNLRLYVAGQTPRSTAALSNLKRICEEYLAGRYTAEVIDLMKTPQLAREHQILAVPTLVRELPEPLKRIIGDLSDTDRALVGLELKRAP